MVIALMMSTLTPWLLADRRKFVPLPSGPFSRTGMVSDTLSPLLAFSRLRIAWNRRSIEVGSAIDAPSMSKSRWFTWYLLITLWYAWVRAFTSVHDWPSSTPPAPPKEMIVWAPSLWARAMRALAVELLMSRVSPQIGLHPLPMMNAAV